MSLVFSFSFAWLFIWIWWTWYPYRWWKRNCFNCCIYAVGCGTACLVLIDSNLSSVLSPCNNHISESWAQRRLSNPIVLWLFHYSWPLFGWSLPEYLNLWTNRFTLALYQCTHRFWPWQRWLNFKRDVSLSKMGKLTIAQSADLQSWSIAPSLVLGWPKSDLLVSFNTP